MFANYLSGGGSMDNNTIMNQGKDALKEVEQLTLDTLSQVTERMRDSSKKLKVLVRENPGLSIAAGVAVGFILAQLSKDKK
jgi:ElaB/YqjD/DUF883 family membrane-anchored ribosome-binding protein